MDEVFIDRKALKYLKDWKKSSIFKPLIIDGARQVGKTSLVNEFSSEFDAFVSINFEKTPEAKDLFQNSLAAKDLINKIQIITGKKIEPGKTLLFLDEIQECEKAVTALRYFYEDCPALHVIAAGSLLQFTINSIGVPVGRVSYLYLYPVSFFEFLDATGNSILRQHLEEHHLDSEVEPVAHQKALELCKEYFVVGGMPEAVATYIRNNDITETILVHSDLINNYRKDMRRYSSEKRVQYVDLVFSKIPSILSENFKYSKVEPDVRSLYLKEALHLLSEAKLAYLCYHTSANGVPLMGEINEKIFKVFFVDIGLALNLLGLNLSTWASEKVDRFINRGKLAEQFVAQELIASANARMKENLFFWQREKRSSSAEIDFVTSKEENIIGIEVKYGNSNRFKSLQVFLEEKKVSRVIKLSSENYSYKNGVTSLPIYFACRLKDIF